MECYCEQHLAEINNEDNFLLDDKNALPLLSDFDSKAYCVRCRKLSTGSKNEGITMTEELDGWKMQRSGSLNSLFPNIVDSNQRFSNTADSMDSPLLVNDTYSDITMDSRRSSIEEFHCHDKSFPVDNNRACRKLVAAAFMCLLFMVVEIIGGYLASSLAVMTDAAHLLSDFICFLVSIFAIWISQRPATKKMPFGYYRAEVLGALFSIVVVWILTGIFIYFALLRLLHRDFEIQADNMMIISAIGVGINVVMGLILHGVCHDLSSHYHSHNHAGHSHDKQNNINVRAAVIHVIGDFIQSVGVLIASIIIKNYPDAKIADPICTFLFSILVIFTTKSVFCDSINILMEGFPPKLNYNLVYTALKSIDGIRNVHNLQIWSLTTERHVLAAHLAIDDSLDKDYILKKATLLVRSKFKIQSNTFQIESYKENAVIQCPDCRLLPD